MLGEETSLEEAGELLAAAEFGVLGLARASEAYTLPVSFGYDEALESLYFMLAFEPDSKKREFIAATDRASFVVSDSDLPDSWASVFFSGTLSEVPGARENEAYAALADNAAFPASYTFAEYIESTDIEQAIYEFAVETVTARQANPGGLTD